MSQQSTPSGWSASLASLRSRSSLADNSGIEGVGRRGFINGGLALGLAAAVGASGAGNAWAKSARVAKPAAIVPSSTKSVFTLNFATNSGKFSGSQAQLGALVRKVYKGPIGPFTKFYDGNKGIRATIANLQASGFSAANGDCKPYICYRPAASDADLAYAFNWLIAKFPNQPIYLCHDQEPENKKITPAQYIAKTNQEYRVRATNPAWAHWIKLWPCMMGYQETDAKNKVLNWKTLVLPSRNKINGMSWDIYDMDYYRPTWSPQTYIGPMLAAAKTLGKPCALGEWGTTVSIKGGDSEARRAARTQQAIDYINANAYDPHLRPYGVKWAAWWENYEGIVGNPSACATGLVCAAHAGHPQPVLGVLLKAMGR